MPTTLFSRKSACIGLISAVAGSLTACGPSAETQGGTVPTLTPLWTLDGFDAPESVIAGTESGTYYVSNVGGEGAAKDGDGAIALISGDGTVLQRRWVEGTDALPLHAPKGMALVGDRLYVSDIDTVVVIDAKSGQMAARTPVPGAGFLNDVAAAPDGTILISDSANARIYALNGDTPSVWLEDERLGGVNGLQFDAGRWLVTTMSEGELLSIDPQSKAITGFATGMTNADGIGLRADGSVVTSSWPGQLWHVREGEAPTLLQDTSGETDAVLMNDILLVDGTLLITPNWMPGTVRAYRID